MARYQQQLQGVFDTQAGELVRPRTLAWVIYQRWLDQGNTPDPLPAPSAAAVLSERKLAYLRELFLRYVTTDQAPLTVGANTWALGVDERRTLTGVAIGASVPSGFGWWRADGAFVALTTLQTRALVDAIHTRDFLRRKRYEELRAAIAASPNPDGRVLSDDTPNPDYVDITVGWPT